MPSLEINRPLKKRFFLPWLLETNYNNNNNKKMKLEGGNFLLLHFLVIFVQEKKKKNLCSTLVLTVQKIVTVLSFLVPATNF